MIKLISLEEHNAIIADQYHDHSANLPARNGISCPRCKKELYDYTPNMVIAGSPPKKATRCMSCGYTGTRLA